MPSHHNRKDEVTARAFGWQHYEFKFRRHDGTVDTRRIYAADDETAAELFNKVYAKDCKEIL